MMERELFDESFYDGIFEGDTLMLRLKACASMKCYAPLFSHDSMTNVWTSNSMSLYRRIRILFKTHGDHNLVAEIIRLERL